MRNRPAIEHQEQQLLTAWHIIVVALRETQMIMQVPLSVVQPAAVQPQPVQEVAVFENERFMPLRGWNSSNLLPTDRKRYSGPGGQNTSDFPILNLDSGPQPFTLTWLQGLS